MKLSYSPEVDILRVAISPGKYEYGEDNQGVIVLHGPDGTPQSLDILDAKLFVMLANTSLVTGKEITNPAVAGTPYTKARDVPVRSVPRGDADLRFNYHADSDTLTVKFGSGDSKTCRRNQEIVVYYGQNELPAALEIEKAREFVLAMIKSVLLREEVSIA